MVKGRSDTPGPDEAVVTVLKELLGILAPFMDDIVIVGGMVPWIFFNDAPEKPLATKDVDLVVRARKSLAQVDIRQILLEKGYEEDPENRYRYHRRLPGKSDKVHVDFLAGVPEEDQTSNKILGVYALPSNFFELAFARPEVKIFNLPGLGEVQVKFANIPIFIVLKAVAMGTRLEGENKTKDAHDIYYCIKNFPGGIPALADAFKIYLEDERVKTGLNIIDVKFSFPQAEGILDVINSENLADPEAVERLRRDAFEKINDLLKRLGFRK